ncbi:bifunctional aminoglycoside phosphotransferase/ATP-binding protein [uncultured Agrobacterium sp.]|uniref:bifunctional aminoglycoside phosphotransferase/ATP-binding protein n=1 Tax=uncultured Agrobacterium sp. TaxID=157277 RepID=UPI0025E52F54|nr:bifunctional aminoglycoside phosphotransferase/ATP-binding protein [uncultured Agrobacterium sp.]
MPLDTQKDVIAFLSNPATFGEAGPVERIETHISIVFLTAKKAYKLKKAVKLPYLDFSSPDLRLDACLKEFFLNSPTAPGLYHGVKNISRDENGSLQFADDGTFLDAVVEMTRFDQDQLFDHLAAADKLTDPLMTSTARMVVHFHERAAVADNLDGRREMEKVLDINEAGLRASSVFALDEIKRLDTSLRQTLEHHSEQLRERADNGKIKRCHGDLHLRNICLFQGEPTSFDCIEFNDSIATIDVLYDLAFLLMDLWHEGHDHHANLVMNRYFDESDNDDGFAILPFFLAVRAAVRAHVIATQAASTMGDTAALRAKARAYFVLAERLLDIVPPELIAIGGFSGSGKTTIAEYIAASVGMPPGARILESDRIRKALHGVPAETRLPEAAYRPEVSQRVYAEMALRAQVILADGGCVVADAVFDSADHRSAIEAAASAYQAIFRGIWLDADPAVLWRRVHDRHGGPSDATVEILQMQLSRQVGEMKWHKIDASRNLNACCDDIAAILVKDHLPPPFSAITA